MPTGLRTRQGRRVFHQLVDPLVAKPAPTADPRGLPTRTRFSEHFDALYDDDSWPKLTKGLRALADGDRPDMLLALADEYYERDEDGHYSNSDDAYTAIDCLDNSYPKDPARLCGTREAASGSDAVFGVRVLQRTAGILWLWAAWR